MSITLYGSLPSPYVRRIRMHLSDTPYQFSAVNIYDDEDRAKFSAITPIKKLPVLVDGDTPIFDSHVISQHINKLRGLAEPSLQQHNVISAIDAVTDSLIILFMGKKSNLNVSTDILFFKLQLERIPASLQWLNQQAEQGTFKDWDLSSIALTSLIDWAEFRELYEFNDYPALLAARDSHATRDIVRNTAPE